MLRSAALEAKRACNALLWLFGEVSSHHCVNSFPLDQYLASVQADAAVQLLRSWEIEAEVAEGLKVFFV